MRSSAAIARPDKSCSAVGLLAEGKAENRRRNSRAHERQHPAAAAPIPILSRPSFRRWGGHDQFPVRARQRHCRRGAPDRSRSEREIIAGGTNLIDLMKEDVERPTRLIDISRLPLKSVEETAEWRLAHRRAGAELRPRLSPAGRAMLSAARERNYRRRLAAIAQHGVDRRQSSAAHALLLSCVAAAGAHPRHPFRVCA